MLEYSSGNSVLKIIPERIYFAFSKFDVGRTMKRSIKIYNKAPGSIKINIPTCETEIFTFKLDCTTKIIPGIPLTVTIEFKPTKETKYIDWLCINCENGSRISLPVIAVPYTKINPIINDTCSEDASSDRKPIKCPMVNGNKKIKHIIKHKNRYRKIVRFKIDSDVSSHKKENHANIFSKDSKKFTQHDVNIALMKKPPISEPNEELGPDGSFTNDYLSRRKKHENEFFEKVREIQLLDLSAERNPNVVRLFTPEITSEEIMKVQEHREMQASGDKEIFTVNQGTHPIYLRQKLITKWDKTTDWRDFRPPEGTTDLWIFRYEALWKFVQVARSIIIHNRLVKRLELLKVFVLSQCTSLVLVEIFHFKLTNIL